MSKSLSLTNQPGWQLWVNPSDSPEGAFLGTLSETANSLSATVPLGRTISPGRYYVAFKLYDYKAKGIFTAFLGGGSGIVADIPGVLSPEWAQFTKWWTVPVQIDVLVPTNSLRLTFQRTLPQPTRQLYLLKGLYITTAASELVLGNDSVVNLHRDDQLDATADVKGNLIANSSFEVGGGHGWGLSYGGERHYTVASLWDNTVGYDGTASMKVPNIETLISRVYRVRGNRKYTLSAAFKTPVSGTVTMWLETGNGVSLPTNFPPLVVLSNSFSLNTSWRRVSLSGILWDYPTADYQIRIKVNDPQGRFTWVDAVQLEEGDLTDYSPSQSLEVGLVSDHPSNLFLEDEEVAMQLRVRNSGAETKPAMIIHEIYDYLNRRVAGGTTNVVVPARGRWTGSLNLSSGRRGIFRVVVWVAGVNQTREEVVFAVLPEPQQMGLDPASIIGIHANFTDFQLAALQKLGVKWNRASSPSRAFRWSVIQPSAGSFQWSGDDMVKANNHGISVLGTLGLEWPAWADNGGRPDLAKWEAFVETVVTRYKSQVKYWEIWNEPNWQLPANYYSQILQRAVTGALRADPTAKLVGLGGVAYPNWAAEALGTPGNNYVSKLHAVSTHIYPTTKALDYSDFRKQIGDVYGLPVWNTEAGVWDRGFYIGENSNFIQANNYAWPHSAAARYEAGHRSAAEILAYGFLHNVGNGLSKYFYYDARTYVGPSFPNSHPTIFEYDDTIRAKGVAYGILARFFDHSTGLGNISSNSNNYIYLFDRGGTPLLAMWSQDGLGRFIRLNADVSQYSVYDLMGNPLALVGGSIPYGPTPVYVEGRGLSVASLKVATQTASVALSADHTPPNLSLICFPTGPTDENPIKLRWLAVDETSGASDANPEGLLYSYRLAGVDPTWSAWQAGTFADYNDLPGGVFEFSVKAKDAANNVSPAATIAITVPNGTGDGRPAKTTNLRIIGSTQ